MSGTVNALAMSGAGNVLGDIANPPNPLDMAQKAQSLQKGQYELQQTQAQQAAGQILQQSTDENGNTDYNKAASLAAKAGPGVAWQMQTLLKNNSDLRTAQINQGNAIYGSIARGAATIMNDSSDANVNSTFDSLIATHPGQRAEYETERQRVLAMPQAQRVQYAYQHLNAALDANDAMHRSPYGQTTPTNVGGQFVPLQSTQSTPYGPGGITQGPGSVTTTASPDTVISQPLIEWRATADDVKKGLATSPGDVIRMPRYKVDQVYGPGLLPPGATVIQGGGGGGGGGGVVGSDGKPVSPNNPPRLLNTPGGNQGGGQGQGQGGGSNAPPGAASSPYTGGGIGSVLNRPAPAPTSAAPPASSTTAPAPAPAPASTSQPRSDLGGGVAVASTNPLAPDVGPASPPSPAVQGDVNALMAGIRNAQTTGRTPGTRTAASFGPMGFSSGPGYEEAGNAATSQDRLNADNQFAANYAANVFPQVQALNLYGRGMTTAPGSDFLNTAKGWTGGFLRSMGFTGAFDSTKEYDELHKWLSQIVTSNPYAAGSDARLAATLQGNANTGIHEQAAADMLKTGIALMRMRATADAQWNAMSPQEKAQYGYYNDFLRQFNKDVDIRGFAIDMMNTEQKKTLLADIKAHGGAGSAYEKKIMDTRQMATDAGYMGSERAMP